MSSANDRPPARPTTSSPYARLSREGDATRTQTGTRVKVPVEARPLGEESGETEAPEPVPSGPAVSPEALKRPYASLSPVRSTESDAPSSAPPSAARPRTTSTRADAPDSRRWNDTTEARRQLGLCRKHNLARSPSGECLLCKKEALAARGGSSRWTKLIVVTLLGTGALFVAVRFLLTI